MPLTRDFRETVMARVKSDPAFRGELIVEATNAFLMDYRAVQAGMNYDYAPMEEILTGVIERTLKRRSQR